ncbi:MAG TPA: hypothetical protein VFW38_00400 [Solirubrobacteraceae bacterium]|nr:hypothetical protein [Solirubrobacteraceae bacterium]
MTDGLLAEYLSRPMRAPEADVLASLATGPIAQRDALELTEVERLLDPAPLAVETGWCVLENGVACVAVRTEMPGVSGEMVDWWFDWHPRESVRYRVWHPLAHISNSFEGPKGVIDGRNAGGKAHWGTVHHPVEDVGTGVVHARIEFKRPSEMGFQDDCLDDPRVATIVCGYAGDDRLRVRHTPMYHVFLRAPEEGGLVLRSRFWIGAALRPYVPGPLAAVGERVLNRPFVRRRALPRGAPAALAKHCAEEYANLGALLAELYARCG